MLRHPSSYRHSWRRVPGPSRVRISLTGPGSRVQVQLAFFSSLSLDLHACILCALGIGDAMHFIENSFPWKEGQWHVMLCSCRCGWMLQV
jgi:hypothetical protein